MVLPPVMPGQALLPLCSAAGGIGPINLNRKGWPIPLELAVDRGIPSPLAMADLAQAHRALHLADIVALLSCKM